jgi:hypothetical protein
VCIADIILTYSDNIAQFSVSIDAWDLQVPSDANSANIKVTSIEAVDKSRRCAHEIYCWRDGSTNSY